MGSLKRAIVEDLEIGHNSHSRVAVIAQHLDHCPSFECTRRTGLDLIAEIPTLADLVERLDQEYRPRAIPSPPLVGQSGQREFIGVLS